MFIPLLFNPVNIVVVDEAHKVIAPSYSKVINTLCKKGVSLIGLTATPGRGKDKAKENQRLSNFFGRRLLTPKFSNNPIAELRERKVLSKIERKIINTNIDVELESDDLNDIESSFDLPGVIIKKLANNVVRNRIILDVISDELIKGNPSLVFSCSVEHSKILSSALNYKGYNSAYIDCKLRKGSRKRVINGFRNGDYDVLFNYGVLSTGFDAPKFRTIIITRPTSSGSFYIAK